MKKTLVSLFCVLALCLGLLPTTALAAGEIELYVAGQRITESGCYANQDGTWTKVDGTEPASGQFYYDADTVTLTLNGAEISHNENVGVGSGAYYRSSVIAFSQSADVSLNIVVSQGTSTITGTGGIRVMSEAGDASLSISGPGSLEVNVTGSFDSGISLIGSKNVNLNIDDADVKTSSASLYGADLHAGDGFKAAAVVNNGKLTAGAGGGIGIYYRWTNPSNSDTSILTVSGNAVVDTRDSKILISSEAREIQVSAGSDGNGGVVWNGKSGTVYGNVTLQDPLTIDRDETLTVPEGSALNTNGNLTNNGAIINKGALTGEVKGNGTVESVPQITTDTLNAGTVGTEYSQTLAAKNNPTEWNVTTGALPDGLTLDKTTGVISGTPTAAGTSTFTVTAANSIGSDSKQFTIQVSHQPTTITTQPQSAAVTVGQTAAFTVAATGHNLTYQWQQSTDGGKTWANISGATGESYTTAATTMSMNGYQYGCVVKGDGGQVTSNAATLTVNPVSVTGVTLNSTTLSLFTGDSAILTATVAPANATNKTVTWSSSQPAIATVDANGKVTAVAAGKANITVTTADGNKTATCTVTVTGRTYTLSSDPGAIGFGSVYTGYARPAAQVVVVKNTGNQTLNLTRPEASYYDVGKLSKTTLKPGERANFTIQPKAGMGAGNYSETLEIFGNGGAKTTVNLTFTVRTPSAPAATATPAPGATPAPTPLEMHTLHFDTNGGLPLDDVKFGLGAPVELWPYTPVRAGYLFQGWYSDQALTKAVGTVVLTKDTTIYAKWAVDPAAAAAQSGSSGSGSGSGSGSSGGKGGSTSTITVTPAPTADPTPEPTATMTPAPAEAPVPTVPPQEDEDQGSFPVVPVAAGVIILVVLVGGIVIFRRFRG